MITLIILCIISVVLSIAIYPLYKIKFRHEDAQSIAEGKIVVKSEVILGIINGHLEGYYKFKKQDELALLSLYPYCIL